MIQDEKISYSFQQLSKWIYLKDVDKQLINLLQRLSDSKSIRATNNEAEILFEEVPNAISILFRSNYPNFIIIASILKC